MEQAERLPCTDWIIIGERQISNRKLGHTYDFSKLAVSDTHSSTPSGISELVPLMYSRPELSVPSQINSETLLSFVSTVILPLFKSIKFQDDEVLCVSQEYSDAENKATSLCSVST
jgi:hypothetical protein